MNREEFVTQFLEIVETRSRWRNPAKELYSEFFGYVSDNWEQDAYNLVNEITKIPACQECERETNFISFNKGYTRFCSKQCIARNMAKNRDEEAAKDKRAKTNLARYGVENPFLADDFSDKASMTFKEKYGVEHALQSDIFQKKKTETMVKRHGVEHALQSDIFQKKKTETMVKRHGVEHALQSPEKIEKLKATNEMNLGVSYPMQDMSVREKSKKTVKERYGVVNVSSLQEIKEKKRKTTLNNYGVEYALQNPDILARMLSNSQRLIRNYSPDSYEKLGNEEWLGEKVRSTASKIIANDLGVSLSAIHVAAKRHGIELPGLYSSFHPKVSRAETEIFDFVSKHISAIQSERKQIHPLELDIYIPEKSLAIELNGIYWHSDIYKDRFYHINKRKVCEEKGIELIQITDKDWNENQNLVKGMILSRIGKAERIYARKCKVVEINSREYQNFCINNHIQGYSPASIKLGLLYNSELVQVMSFSKSRYDKKYDWELIRLCSKIGYNIIGGSKKLFKHHPCGNIISYCNRHYFTGNVYRTLGFSLVRENAPNYYWFKGEEFSNRQKYQKHLLKGLYERGIIEYYTESETENEIMKKNGFLKYYDAGHDVYEYIGEL